MTVNITFVTNNATWETFKLVYNQQAPAWQGTCAAWRSKEEVQRCECG